MHRIVHIAALSVIYLSFAVPANAERPILIASNDTIQPVEEVEMDEVVVSAQRVPVAFSQTARLVNVIGKEELSGAPVHDLQDLLKFASNIDVRQRGINGVQADLTIRGSSFDQVLILLNGIPLNDPQTGHHNLNLPVSFDAIDRIEIMEGSASRLYGPNAFGGAINIISAQSTVPAVTGRVSTGQFGFFESALATVLKTGNLSHSLSADFKRADGALQNTDFKSGNAFYHGSLLYPTGKLELQGGYTNRGFGANDFYTPVYPNQFEKIKTTFASIKATKEGFLHITPSVYWRRNQDRFELFRDFTGAPSWYKTHNYHLTDTYGADVRGWLDTDYGKLAFGTDFRKENIKSNVLGLPMKVPVSVPGESGILFDHEASRSNVSLFGEYSNHLGPFDLSGGVMVNHNSSLGNNWQIYPGFDLGWNISSSFKFYASVNKSLRMPTYTDLYYKSATNAGNPNLLPEEALSYEGGLKYAKPGFSAKITFFERRGQNMIDWVRQPAETVWSAKNITELNTAGMEVSTRINWSALLGKDIFLRTLEVSYNYLTQNKESGSYISKYLLDYLKHKLDIKLSHKLFKQLNASWMLTGQDRNGTYTYWTGNKYGDEISYKTVWLVDGRISWTSGRFEIFLEGTNLLNRAYFDYGNIEQPGIWARTGVVIKL